VWLVVVLFAVRGGCAADGRQDQRQE